MEAMLPAGVPPFSDTAAAAEARGCADQQESGSALGFLATNNVTSRASPAARRALLTYRPILLLAYSTAGINPTCTCTYSGGWSAPR